MTAPRNVLISAAEPSGDRAGGRVAAILHSRGVRCFGIGGSRIADAGARLVAEPADHAALGIADPLRGAARWAAVWAALRKEIVTQSPAAALLIDAPEFNLPLARVLKAEGIPVVYYIGPQVWAWRPHRLRLMRARTDIVALILPFEKALYDRAEVRAVFVGHPIQDEPAPADSAALRRNIGAPADTPLVALLPGSRSGELARHLPAMADAASRMDSHRAVAIVAPSRGDRVAVRNAYPNLKVLPEPFSARDLLHAADAALTASGTATLEATAAGVPFATVYRTDPVSFAAARHLLRLPYVSLPNWIAGRAVVPEILQSAVTGERLRDAAAELLTPAVASAQKAALRRIADALGGPGAAARTAALVLERLQ